MKGISCNYGYGVHVTGGNGDANTVTVDGTNDFGSAHVKKDDVGKIEGCVKCSATNDKMVGCVIATNKAVSAIVCEKGYYLNTATTCAACTDTTKELKSSVDGTTALIY